MPFAIRRAVVFLTLLLGLVASASAASLDTVTVIATNPTANEQGLAPGTPSPAI
jgi:hypothetical protein